MTGEDRMVIARSHDETNGYMTRAEWFTLPLELRQRWWRETDFDRKPPSVQLLAEVRKVLA